MTTLSITDHESLIFLFVGLFLGGLLKGATGAGLPIIAVPVIAAVFDIRLAVILLVIPNFFTNAWQIWRYRKHNTHQVFTRNFAIAGIVGAAIGTALLATLPLSVLSIFIAIVVFLYVALRLLRPDFVLDMGTATKLAFLSGGSGGVLQGAVGLSAPIAITFLHATRQPRSAFVFTSSVFFASMSLVQVPMQFLLGLMSWTLAATSLTALLPILMGLVAGNWIGKRMSQRVFDHAILVLLTALGCKMLMDAF